MTSNSYYKAILAKSGRYVSKTCDHCLVGKAHRVAFHTYPTSRRPNVIDLIHTDVCIMQTRTVSCALYFVTFIDDHFRKVWGFALKTKDQVMMPSKNSMLD